jgi:hypothetical protein
MHASRLAKAIHAAKEGTRERGKKKGVWNRSEMPIFKKGMKG